jgi:putative salt-induced outer membrane protein YdiY
MQHVVVIHPPVAGHDIRRRIAYKYTYNVKYNYTIKESQASVDTTQTIMKK